MFESINTIAPRVLTVNMDNRAKHRIASPKAVLNVTASNPTSLLFLKTAYDFGFITFNELERLRGEAIAQTIGGKNGR